VQAKAKPLRETVGLRPPQPKMRTDLDIGAEKSETITVSEFRFAFFEVKFKRYQFPKTTFGKCPNG
jgi:hypothetical protein